VGDVVELIGIGLSSVPAICLPSDTQNSDCFTRKIVSFSLSAIYYICRIRFRAGGP
jgi:hypothetical protein